MRSRTIPLAIICQLFLVAGQLFFKRAMRQRPEGSPAWKMMIDLGAGIVLQSVWFFIWINLLEGEKLSRIFPFEGLNPVLIVAASLVFLRERVNWTTTAGVMLICGGIFLASGS